MLLFPHHRESWKNIVMLELGSRCLAYHGPLLYEAKVLKLHEPGSNMVLIKEGTFNTLESAGLAEEYTSQLTYYIHYKGWKATWDEWVPKERVLEMNEENIRTQRELKQAALDATTSSSKRKGRSETPAGDDKTHDHLKKRVRGADPDLEREEDYLKRPEINLTVSSSLKARLVDDWEHITRDHQLISLPSKTNVIDILNMIKDNIPNEKKVIGSTEADILNEVISGLKLYFDRSLGSILLYRFERQQYLQIKKKYPNKPVTELYGGEHLLRLFGMLFQLYSNLFLCCFN